MEDSKTPEEKVHYTYLKSLEIKRPVYLQITLDDHLKTMDLYYFQSQIAKDEECRLWLQEKRQNFRSMPLSSSKKQQKQTKDKLESYKKVGTCFVMQNLLTELFPSPEIQPRKPTFKMKAHFYISFREHFAEAQLEVPYKYVGNEYVKWLKQQKCFTTDKDQEWTHPHLTFLRPDQVISVQKAQTLLPQDLPQVSDQHVLEAVTRDDSFHDLSGDHQTEEEEEKKD